MNPRSVLERAASSQGAFLVGCGGGGDVVQCLPVMNYLTRLGVHRFVLGNIAIKWWPKAGCIPMGAETLQLDWYQPSDRLHDCAAQCDETTRLVGGYGRGQLLHESEVARTTGTSVVALDVHHGARGMLDACRAVMSHFGLDLFITVDIGSDAFFSGTETTVLSPLADAFSLSVALELDGIYALTGYACDAEIPLQLLNRNVSRVMGSGGYLGAHGLTPEDLQSLEHALINFPDDEIQRWPIRAARGDLGTFPCKKLWAIEVTPLAAMTLFFDSAAIAGLNPLVGLVHETQSLHEAEDLIIANTPITPETRLPLWLTVPNQYD